MSRAGWYVIQVETGREEQTIALIMRACQEATRLAELEDPGFDPSSIPPICEECFSPTFETLHKFGKEWRPVIKRLIPGYVIAVTQRPEALAATIRGIRDFSRLLHMGGNFVPLSKPERTWIDEYTKPHERIVPLSTGIKRGDNIIVTSGPLKDREAMIVRLNRRKCLAFVELNVGGKRITTTVGLSIVAADNAGVATATLAETAQQPETAPAPETPNKEGPTSCHQTLQPN